MLLRLKVTNLALLEDLDLEFGPGLNIVTGETGAGKSLLQRALALAAGHRASSEVVRRGADAARIEASFQVPDDARSLLARLDEIGVPVPDRELLVRRTIPRAGKARVSINDSSVTLATLNEVGGVLVHLQGQHESLRLAQPEAHVEMLDAACGTLTEAKDFRAQYGALLKLIARLEAVEQGISEHARRLELARWELEELDEAGFNDLNEEVSLTSERDRLRHGEKLRAAAAEALEQLDLGEPPALAALERQARRMSEMAELDPDLQEIADAHRDTMPVRISDTTHIDDADRPFRVLLPAGAEQRVVGEHVTLLRNGVPVEEWRLSWIERAARRVLVLLRRLRLRVARRRSFE